MVSIAAFRKLALSYKGASKKPHFEVASFRTKKIFATLHEKEQRVCLMLSVVDQSVFCAFDPKVMYPVPNKWGKMGATYVELKKVRKDMLVDALTRSYEKSIEKPVRGKPKTKKALAIIFFLFLSTVFYAQDGKIDTVIAADGSKHISKAIQYPGGLQGLYKDIGANFVLPAKAKKDKIHGDLILDIRIDTTGKIISPKIIQGLRADVDSAVIQMTKKLKRFKPCLMDDKKVPQRMNIPLTL